MQNAKRDEEVERAIITRHREERLEMEVLYMAKYQKWSKRALLKFEEHKHEVRHSRRLAQHCSRNCGDCWSVT